jgi:hypothetical protein
MTQDHSTYQAIASALREHSDSNQGDVLPLAATLWSILREHLEGPVNIEWFKAFLPHVTDHKALLIKDPDIAEAVDGGSDCACDYSDTVLFFEDNTAVLFDKDGAAQPDIVDRSELCIDIDVPFDATSNAVILAASAGFHATHPDLEAWRAGLPQKLRDKGIASVSVAILDRIDAHVDSLDMDGSENWTPEEVEALDAELVEIWLAFGIETKMSVTVYSSHNGEPASVHSNLVSNKPTSETLPIEHNFEKAASAIVDIDRFEGFEWIYNDGASDRISGYDESTASVTSIEIDPESFSNHEKLLARKNVQYKLENTGMTRSKAEALLTISTTSLSQ